MQTNCNYIELLSDLWALALRPELSPFYLVILYEKMVELIIFFSTVRPEPSRDKKFLSFMYPSYKRSSLPLKSSKNCLRIAIEVGYPIP